MFDLKIEFSAHEDYFALKEDYPTPIKLNVPEWYKKLKHHLHNETVKGCMPFLDTLTSGYLLKVPQDIFIRHNIEDNKVEQRTGLQVVKERLFSEQINLNYRESFHDPKQLEGSDLIKKNKNLPVHKIQNPWTIKTPSGYSCLFVPPLNNSDDRFSIIPGIVDTDNYPMQINFPIIINGDKYPVLETIIQKGTPYAQVIPFKRDSWKMSLKPQSKKEVIASSLWYGLNIINVYKRKWWSKKSWN